jgi:two-component system alkaline phosphatase synthesis response regulator PhoP
MNRKLRLLIVEDEPAILHGLQDLFVFHGYDVDTATDGREALSKTAGQHYDLILLDVMLPSMDGFSVCNEIRQQDREQPIIMLTAKTTEDDILTGLTLGADDYISKPFSVRELVLRVEAVLRRSQKLRQQENRFVIGDSLTIDVPNLTGQWLPQAAPSHHSHTAVVFTRREIDILDYLRQHSERPVSREELLSEVWGYEKAARIETRTVDIHIAKLRRKIEPDPKNPAYLLTIRGEGYKLLSRDG